MSGTARRRKASRERAGSRSPRHARAAAFRPVWDWGDPRRHQRGCGPPAKARWSIRRHCRSGRSTTTGYRDRDPTRTSRRAYAGSSPAAACWSAADSHHPHPMESDDGPARYSAQTRRTTIPRRSAVAPNRAWPRRAPAADRRRRRASRPRLGDRGQPRARPPGRLAHVSRNARGRTTTDPTTDGVGPTCRARQCAHPAPRQKRSGYTNSPRTAQEGGCTKRTPRPTAAVLVEVQLDASIAFLVGRHLAGRTRRSEPRDVKLGPRHPLGVQHSGDSQRAGRG